MLVYFVLKLANVPSTIHIHTQWEITSHILFSFLKNWCLTHHLVHFLLKELVFRLDEVDLLGKFLDLLVFALYLFLLFTDFGLKFFHFFQVFFLHHGNYFLIIFYFFISFLENFWSKLILSFYPFDFFLFLNQFSLYPLIPFIQRFFFYQSWAPLTFSHEVWFFSLRVCHICANKQWTSRTDSFQLIWFSLG